MNSLHYFQYFCLNSTDNWYKKIAREENFSLPLGLEKIINKEKFLKIKA